MAALSFVVNGNIPRRTVNELKRLGHIIYDARDTENRGIEDVAIWQIAQDERAVLIATDKGVLATRP